MMQLTEEQKKALVERCEEFIKQCEYAKSAEAMTEADEMDSLITQIALDAMTAEPVAYWHHSGQVLTRDECNNDKVFDICCKVERPLYTAPPVAALRLPVDGLPDVSEESYEYRTGFAMGCACYAKRVIELNATAPAINLAELVPDENEIERIYSIYCTQTVGSKNALRHIRNELLRKIEEVK